MLKATRIKSTCHPELVSGSIENNALNIAGFRNKFGMTECGEDGRSMVEMLGVLAIIGVLSIGGVYGYTTAMNKHRANELLNEASKRAVTVSAQIQMMGNEPPAEASSSMIGEFTNPTGYTFSVAKKNENQFNIIIDAVPSDICTQMKASVGTNTTIRKINETCTEITFNNDMSTTLWASDYEDSDSCTGAGNKWCSGSNACVEEDCCSGVDACQKCRTDGSVSPKTGGECDLNGTAGYCNAGTCTEKPNCDTSYPGTDAANIGGAVPNTNCRCPSGQAWDSTNTICIDVVANAQCLTQDDCGGMDTDYFCNYKENVNSVTGVPTQSGTCELRELGSLPSGAINEGFFRSSGWMDWWSAKNFCTSYNNGQMVHVSDIGIGTASGQHLNVPTGGSCNGNVKCGLTDESGTGGLSAADKWSGSSGIRAKFGNDWEAWTVDIYSSDSNYAFSVLLNRSQAFVDTHTRKRDYNCIAALCK